MYSWEEREAIKKAYPGPKWATKVNRMAQPQIHAIFVRLRKQGKI